MKIRTLIILTPGFPKDEEDDTCLPFLQQFVLQLNQSFPLLKIKVLTFDYPFVKQTYIWKNNEVIAFNGRKKKKVARLFKWKNILSELKQINKDHCIVGILSLWAGECAFLGKIFSGRKDIRNYCWMLGQDAKPGNRYFSRIKYSASGMIAISDFIQSEVENNYAMKPEHVIPVGISGDKIRTTGLKRDIDIIGVGSLIKLKQFQLLIEIVREVILIFPQIQVRICGKGPETTELQNQISNCGLENNILLTGELNHEQIMESMSRTKILLHTSIYEGMPAVCLEALASGCHVISFVRSMRRDIPQWHIVSSKDEMVEKTVILLEDKNLQFHSFIPFTVRDSAEKMMQLFQYRDETIS